MSACRLSAAAELDLNAIWDYITDDSVVRPTDGFWSCVRLSICSPKHREWGTCAKI